MNPERETTQEAVLAILIYYMKDSRMGDWVENIN